MSIITHHTALPDSSQKTDFYSLVDNATATGIVDSDIASTAAIADSKLAAITTAGKVDGSAMNNLSNIPSGAGVLPVANGGIPSGVILMWSGTIATIPSGFYLCNGSNGTPDLRNKFIVGADADVSSIAKSTVSGSAAQSGGAATVNLAHTHTGKTGTEQNIGAGTHIAIGAADKQHDHSISSDLSATQSVLNPYYALAFIMKS